MIIGTITVYAFLALLLRMRCLPGKYSALSPGRFLGSISLRSYCSQFILQEGEKSGVKSSWIRCIFKIWIEWEVSFEN